MVLAFFEDSLEHALGLIPQQAFSSHLMRHYAQPQPAENDLGWYTIRNSVFALGSRLAWCQGGQSANYAVAQSQSWLYFENALSEVPNIVFMPTDMDAIEGLILMVSLSSFLPLTAA